MPGEGEVSCCQEQALMGLPSLVKKACCVLLLWLCSVSCQKLAQQALPSRVSYVPEAPENTGWLLLGLHDKREQ